MINVITKHLIYNTCIDVFFDTVISNYMKPHIKQSQCRGAPRVPISQWPSKLDPKLREHLVELGVLYPSSVNRYDEVSALVGEKKYYQVVKFGDIGKSE